VRREKICSPSSALREDHGSRSTRPFLSRVSDSGLELKRHPMAICLPERGSTILRRRARVTEAFASM
jgi:hypothetical protein